MAVSAKLRWKRYINELRFVNEEIDFVKDISREASREFQVHYEGYCAANGIDLAELNRSYSDKIQKLYRDQKTNESVQQNAEPNASQDGSLVIHKSPSEEQDISSGEYEEYPQQLGDYQMSQDELEIHDAFNKIFRKIAMKLHPDKLEVDLTDKERDVKLAMFKEAKVGLEERRYFTVIDIAEKLDIAEPKNYKQQIRWMKKELDRLNQNLIKEKNTYNYIFSEADTDAEKDSVVKRFMTQLFGAQIFDK